MITSTLLDRVARPRDAVAENKAVHALWQLARERLADLPRQMVQVALDYCNAGSAGIGWLEHTPAGTEVFRWIALAGAIAPLEGGATPRDASPCGLCLEHGWPILLADPVRRFGYLSGVTAPIVEQLIVPIYGFARRPMGAIWILAHDAARTFDSRDLDLMVRLADVAVACGVRDARRTA